MSVVPSQILYLEHGSARLYAEAIQIVKARASETRTLCWARPTLFIQGLPESAQAASRQDVIAAAALNPQNATLDLYDLKDCSDLIWPLELFQVAFDTDFFSLLMQLQINPAQSLDKELKIEGSRRFKEFIRSVWQDHTDAFPPALREDTPQEDAPESSGVRSLENLPSEPRQRVLSQGL